MLGDLKILPVEVRLNIYIKALEVYKNGPAYGYDAGMGLCTAIMTALKALNLYDGHWYMFPEFYGQRPRHAQTYWWPLEDSETRIKVLHTCIELCKKQMEKKYFILWK